MLAGFENRYRNDSTFGIADVLAFKLAAERFLYDERTQTRSLGLVVEVHAVDSVLVLIECEVTTNAAPKTLTGKRQDIFGFAVDVRYIDFLLVISECVVYVCHVDVSRIACAVIYFQRA